MDAKTLERLEREAGIRVDELAALPPSDLRSLWLEVSRRAAARRGPEAVMGAWRANRFVRPSALAPERLLELARAFYAALPEHVVRLELSPVAPLGICSSIAVTHQHRVVSAERGTEVVADPTNVLAFEAAERRRALLRSGAALERVDLATVHRVVRAQALRGPGFVPHFAIAARVTAGRRSSGRLRVRAVRDHLAEIARWVAALDPRATLRVALTPLEGAASREELEAEIFAPLSDSPARLSCDFDPGREAGRRYYRWCCFKVHASLPGAEPFELSDGGFTDWTSRLLSDRRELLLISGSGLERTAAALEASAGT